MKFLKNLVIFISIIFPFFTQAIGFDSSYSLEMKIKDGGSSGEVLLTHPRIKGREAKSGVAKIYNFLNTNALLENRVSAITYVCMNKRVIIFQKKDQALNSSVTTSSFFSSGRVARNLFPVAFSWLASASGMNGSDPSELACREDFLESVSRYRLESLKNIKFDRYELSQKKAFFGSKVSTLIKW